MTPCPICRGRADPDCMCEDGYISAELILNHRPTVEDTAIFWTVTIAALVPWALLIWKGLPI